MLPIACSLLFGAAYATTSTSAIQQTSSEAATETSSEIPSETPNDTDSAASALLRAALGVEIHGFVSQGFIKTSTNNYLARSARGSFELTEVGINFTKNVTEDLRAGIQLFARKLGSNGNFSAKLDWFYLDYHFSDLLGIRAGRLKLPFGLYTETSDIDAARVPVLLPQSIYPTRNRDFLLAQTGGEVYGRLPLGVIGGLEYRLYGGTIFVGAPDTPPGPISVTDVDTPYLIGGRLLWENGPLRLGGSLQALRLDTYATIFGMPVTVEIPAVLWVLSAEYAHDDVLIAAEYSRWHLEGRSTNQTLFPNVTRINERFYALVSYQVKDWFHPAVYYSVLFPNTEIRERRDGSQQDWALSLRFDVNSFWLVKVEGHYLRGTADLQPELNDNKPLSELENDWFLLLLKTTLFF